MAQYELHADYDRDGRVAADQSEYGLRDKSPGAQILPNVDRDDRALPTKVADTAAPTLDWALPTKLAQDNEPVRLLVRAVQPVSPNAKLFLRSLGHLREHVRLTDRYGRSIAMQGFSDFPLAVSGAEEEEFWVGTDVFAATPLAESIEGVTEPRSILLKLVVVEPDRKEVQLDAGMFTLPQLMILDDLAPAERLYVAQADGDDNLPSIQDVEAAAQKAGVPVLRIPLEMSFDDVWVQDQFQLAWCRTVKGPRRFILHLPRSRANFTWVSISTNLAPFVAKHFPSKDLGLIEDFWRRTFRLKDVAGVSNQLKLEESQYTYMEMGRGLKVRRTLMQMGAELLSMLGLGESSAEAKELKGFQSEGKVGVLQGIEQIKPLQTFVSKLLSTAISSAGNAKQRAALEERRQKLIERVSWALGGLQVPRPGVLALPIGTQKRVEVDAAEADRLYDQLEVAHDSTNFGGNIECSPPLPGSPNGKVVIGNSDAESGAAMDPDLLNFLLGQEAQRIVELDTGWLKVAHVDEVMSFLPHKGGTAGFAVVRGSSGLGIALVREALSFYRDGLSINDAHQPGPILPLGRETTRGKHPVTMMLRGKHWSHFHPKEAFEPHEPPLLFRRLSWWYTMDISPMHPDERYQPGPLKATDFEKEGVRRYPARMSILEFDFLEENTNDEIETKFLTPLDEQLKEQFPDVPVLRVPLLFDVPGSFQNEQGQLEHNFSRSISSFLPDAANLQVLGSTVLIPRQYGPRLMPEYAAEVVKAVLKEQWPDFKPPKINTRWFAARGLDKCVCWLREESDRQLAHGVTTIAGWFADGFPKGMEISEVARRIQAANPGSIRADGRLRAGWQRLVIPENTVDLFEACIAAALEESGVEIEWVDSWHYHVHGGEIHCGTNVLRRVREK